MTAESRGLTLAALALLLSGCASAPENIKAADIDSAQYAYLTCPQLVTYEGQLNVAYNGAAQSEENARIMDGVGWMLLTPVGSMTHEGTPKQIADLKGRIAAVHALETAKSCPQS
jgi:starvation-inducible outer membrane lipoprotein